MTAASSVLILNPTSGLSPMAVNNDSSGSVEEHILAALGAHGIEPKILYTSEDDPGDGLARRAVEEGAELVIAAGGDGTLHAVADGLVGAPATLGIIPLGTMNNVARSLEIPEDIDEACAIIANGVAHQIDMGIINGEVFLEVAGIGLEAAIFPAAEDIKRASVWSRIRGAVRGLVTLLNFRPTRFVASFDDRRTRRFHAIQISVCNSPYYGARLQFAPKAVMDDGFLDVLLYKNFSTLEYIRHALSISQGRRALEPRVTRRKIKNIRVSAEEPVPIHADGVPAGTTPAFVSIQPGVLRVRVPQKVAIGPNVVRIQEKQARRYKQAKYAALGKRGPLNVS